MFPGDDINKLFPQELKMYRKGGGLFCAGNGEVARRWDENGELKDRPCPCEYLEGDKPQCKPTGVFHFMIPEVKGFGVWQMVVHGKSAIRSLNSGLDHALATYLGLMGIPFLLKLEVEETQRFDEKKREMVRTTIHVPRLDAPVSYMEVLQYRRALGSAPITLMLPPAPDHEEIDDANGEQEQPVPAAVTKPEPQPLPAIGSLFGKQKTAQAMGWTIESCYKAATSLGVSADQYRLYLEGTYQTAEINSGPIQEQAEMFEKAESAGAQGRDLLAKTIRLAASKQAGKGAKSW